MNDRKQHSRRTEHHAPTSFGEGGTEPGVGIGWRCIKLEAKEGATRSGHPQPQGEGGGKRVHHSSELSLRLHACGECIQHWMLRHHTLERTVPNMLERAAKPVQEQGCKLLIQQRSVELAHLRTQSAKEPTVRTQRRTRNAAAR